MKIATLMTTATAACVLAATSAWAADTKTTVSNATRSNTSGFAKLDKDKDGYITRAEAGSDAVLTKDFGTFDLNHDGKLNRAEYLAARAKEDTKSLFSKVTGKEKTSSSSGSSAKP